MRAYILFTSMDGDIDVEGLYATYALAKKAGEEYFGMVSDEVTRLEEFTLRCLQSSDAGFYIEQQALKEAS